MMKSIGFLCSLLILSPLPAAASATDKGAVEQSAKAALQRLEQQQGTLFSYQRHSTMGDNSKLESFQAEQEEGQQWQLLQENEQQPSAQRLREYRQMRVDEAKSAEQQDEEQQSVKLSLSRLVQQDTLSYQQQTQWRDMTVHHLTFVPHLDKFSEHNDKLQGHLYLSADGQQLEGLQIALKESFSPATSVTLDDFQLTIDLMTLQSDHGESYIVPEQTEEVVTGSYLFFKDFDDHTVRQYTHYEVLPKPASESASANLDSGSMPCGSSGSNCSR